MCEAAMMPLPVGESITVAEDSLASQTATIAKELPDRPVVLGGCCCTHIGAVAGLAQRHGRIGVVWLDAHGDLNTPQSSPSGNEWGMPFRIILDDGHAAVGDCILIGARSLDPPEQQFIAENALADSVDDLDRVLSEVDGVYVAFDCDVLDAGEIACFMPEPGGIALDEGVAIVRSVYDRVPVLGLGLTGLVSAPENIPRLLRLCDAAGLAE
jgi:arginase